MDVVIITYVDFMFGFPLFFFFLFCKYQTYSEIWNKLYQ